MNRLQNFLWPRFEKDLFQSRRFTRQFFFADGKLIEAKNVRDDVHGLLPRKRTGTIQGHRNADTVGKIPER